MSSTSTSGEECYTSTQHGTKVVGGFERLWREGLMCDTTLVAESKSFKVHRSYLAACSHYFHAMFTEGFRESEQNQVVKVLNRKYRKKHTFRKNFVITEPKMLAVQVHYTACPSVSAFTCSDANSVRTSQNIFVHVIIGCIGRS